MIMIMVMLIDFSCVAMLIYIAVVDAKKMIISNKILATLFILSIVKQSILFTDVTILLISTGIISMVFIMLYYGIKNFIGGGDVKLIFVLSLWLGYPKIVIALYIAFIIGGVTALIYLMLKERKFAEKIAFAPFLVIGSLISLFKSDMVLNFWQWMIR